MYDREPSSHAIGERDQSPPNQDTAERSLGNYSAGADWKAAGAQTSPAKPTLTERERAERWPLG
jgi:hypothetical protein